MRPRFTRRRLMWGLAPAVSLSRLAFWAQLSSRAAATKLAMPGLFRGRVVKVNHAGCIDAGKYQAEPVSRMMSMVSPPGLFLHFPRFCVHELSGLIFPTARDRNR
jgi:hypothetical protein